MPFGRVPQVETESDLNDEIHDLPNMDHVHIPDQFRKRIISHMLKNRVPSLAGPLILGIQGPPGEGKSFQLRATLIQENIRPIVLSGASLSGQHEGEAILPIKEAYLEIAQRTSDRYTDCCIVIDDFDLSVASTFESAEYTVNSQLLSGFLMNLADNPELCQGTVCRRIPIMVTGNSFTRMYAPLIRHGRFDVYDWVPELSGKIEVVKSLFEDVMDEEEIEKLGNVVQAHSDEPVSFFASLKGDAVNSILEAASGKVENPSYVAMLEFFENKNFKLKADHLEVLAKRRSASSTKDFLKGVRTWLR